MEYLFTVVLLIHVLAAIAIVGLVLVQHGKGADMGAAFGSGASGSLFGATGSANFLSRSTAVLATVFFITSLSLAFIAANKPRISSSVMQDVVESAPASIPVEAASGKADTPSEDDSKAKSIPK